MEHQSAVCGCYGNCGEHYHLIFCEIKGKILGSYVKVTWVFLNNKVENGTCLIATEILRTLTLPLTPMLIL